MAFPLLVMIKSCLPVCGGCDWWLEGGVWIVSIMVPVTVIACCVD